MYKRQIEASIIPDDIVIQPDGRIVVLGTSYLDSGNRTFMQVWLVRFTSGGELDSTFRDGGAFSYDVESSLEERAAGLGLAANGDLLVAGSGGMTSPNNAYGGYLFATRLSPDGFVLRQENTGIVAWASGPVAREMVVQPDGRILVAAAVGGIATLVRYRTDLTIDNSFSFDARSILGIGNIEDVVLQPDGKIVIGGEQNQDMMIARLLPDGSLDPSFGQHGWVTYNLGGSERVYGVAWHPSGYIIAAGSSSGNMAVIKLEAGPGNTAPSFAPGADPVVVHPVRHHVRRPRAVAMA